MHALNRLACRAATLAAACLISGCIATSPKVVKIGLVAPFEGRYREIGDQVIPAARLALREYAARYPDNQIVIELVAYDDRGIAELAAEQARKLAADPDVAAVIGHWRDDTTRAALPIYQQAGIPLITFSPAEMGTGQGVTNLSPSLDEMRTHADAWNQAQTEPATILIDGGDDVVGEATAWNSRSGRGDSVIGGPAWGFRQFDTLITHQGVSIRFVSGAVLPEDIAKTDWPKEIVSDFVRGFEESSLGAPPGLLSAPAYEATWTAITYAAQAHHSHADGGPAVTMIFDASGRRLNAPVFLYRWDAGQIRLVKRLR